MDQLRTPRFLRALACPTLLFPLLGASAPEVQAVKPIDINESGRVLAQLDDVRAIFFVLVIVIVMLLMLVIWERRASSGNMARALEKLASSVDNMTRISSERDVAELVHNARVESVMGRIDAHLARHGDERDEPRR